MTALWRSSLVAAAVLGLLGGSARASHSVASFFTPNKAAYCKFHVPLGFDLKAPPVLECWTPNDGFTVAMRPRSAVRKAYVDDNKWRYARFIRRLTFKQDWWGSQTGDTTDGGVVVPTYGEGTGSPRGTMLFRCRSRPTGLTCENRAGHGFWLGRFRGYRIY